MNEQNSKDISSKLLKITQLITVFTANTNNNEMCVHVKKVHKTSTYHLVVNETLKNRKTNILMKQL